MELSIQKNVPLAPLTTLGIGGTAAFLAEVHSVAELQEAIAWAHAHDQPVTILGGGSNVLVSDDGIHGLVIKNSVDGIKTETRNEEDVVLITGAGVVFDDLVAYTVQKGWWGLENLSSIPGSVGATPIQNVGAYGVEIQDHILWVEVYDQERMEIKKLSNDECDFSYRHSLFKTEEGKRYIVTRVAFILYTQPTPKLEYRDLQEWFKEMDTAPTQEQIRAAVMRIRARKFPDWTAIGTAGSFFKNPVVSREKYTELTAQYPDLPGYDTGHECVKIPLGFILDKVLQLKGYREGAVGLYEKQALVLVNYDNANAHDVEQFAKKIQQKVFDAVAVTVEWEVTKLY